MARDYGNGIVESRQTGFASACSEYAEMGLSLDEHFDALNPGKKFIVANSDNHFFQIKKGDILLIQVGAIHKRGDLIYCTHNGQESIHRYEITNGAPTLFPPTYSRDELDDVISGVVLSLHRPLITDERRSSMAVY